MRMGRIVFQSYLVDLDDEQMVEHAKDCAVEDIYMAVKYNEVANLISVVEEPNADPANIPEFLTGEEEEHFDEDEHDNQRHF